MPDLLADTCVEPVAGRSGCWRATLSPEWAVWGPNGGYLAVIALRAAMAASRLPRPASFHCHFLASGAFAPVELSVRSLGGGKRAESLHVEMRQEERSLLSATVWMTDDALAGFEHDHARAPDVPAPSALRGYQDLVGDEYAEWYPIWRSIEGRPVGFREPPGEPRWRLWTRFTDTPIADRAADALRQLFWLDLPGWNAMTAAHPWPFRFLAPNLDLGVHFHRFAPEATWMLVDGHAPLATGGLVSGVARLWSEDGRLLATGTSKHVCRPNPGYEEELARARALGLVPAAD